MRKLITEIYLQTIRNNALAFARHTGKPVCAVVKADAYGHGAVEVANALQSVVDSFAVSLLDEALSIRTVAGGKDILILTPPLRKEDADQAVYGGFCMTVDTLTTAKLIAERATALRKTAFVHLKVNTGMNRYGMNVQTLGKTCAYLRRCPWVQVKGLYSHFYGNDVDTLDGAYRAFLGHKRVCVRYFPWVKCHISATYGATFGSRFAQDFVRVGIGLYGYLPDGVALSEQARTIGIRPAMRAYAQISAKRTYQSGGVGYGKPKRYPLKGETVHVVRVGYADGFLRQDCTEYNTLCMDACLRSGKARVGAWTSVMDDAERTAKRAGTISYEVLCAMNRRTERIYTYDEIAFCAKGRRGRKCP